jgi:hypothetical protein
VRRYGKAS